MFAFMTSFLIVVLFIAPIHAQEERTSLNLLIQEMLANNPSLQAAESKWKAALERPSQLSALPDPVLSFVARKNEQDIKSAGLMWEQYLPFPGKLKIAGNIAEREAESINAEKDVLTWSAIAELKIAYNEFYRSQETLKILSDSRDLLRRFAEIAQARYSVGDAIQQDVLRSQVEVSIVDQRITVAEQEKATAVAEINRLLNRTVDSSLQDVASVAPLPIAENLEEIQEKSEFKPPQVASVESLVERERLGVDLAKKQYRPDFISSVEIVPDMWRIQFGLRIPLFYKKKQAAGIRESGYSLSREQKELIAVKQEIVLDIRKETLQIESSEKLLNLYEQAIIPQSALAMESGIASYQVGKADFLTTLNNFLTVLEYRMNYFEEVAKHESAIARLEQTLGRTLARRSPDRRTES